MMKKERATMELPASYTPAPDVLIELYGRNGLIPALIWGKVWRYTKMKDGVCRASILRMSRELRISPKTFSKYLKKLVEDEFILDLTPNLTFSRHIYICTDKIHKETEEWFADREAKDALLPWFEGEEIEMKPASTKVNLEGNGSPLSRDHVPPEKGPGTYKDRRNIEPNTEVKENPLTAEKISSEEVRGHLPAIKAEGSTDGISRLDGNEDLSPGYGIERNVLRKYGLNMFEDIEQKEVLTRIFSEAEGDPHYDTFTLRDVSDRIEENASTMAEAIDWLEANELWINKRILEVKVKKTEGELQRTKEFAKVEPEIGGILVPLGEKRLDEIRKRLDSIEIQLNEQ